MKKNKNYEIILIIFSLVLLVTTGYFFQTEKLTSYFLNTQNQNNIIGQVNEQKGHVYIRSIQDSVWHKVNAGKKIYYQDSIVSLSNSKVILKIPAFKIEKLELGPYSLVKFLIFRNKPLLVISHGEVNVKIEEGFTILVEKNDRIEELKNSETVSSENTAKNKKTNESDIKQNNEFYPKPNNVVLVHQFKGFINIYPAEKCTSNFCYLSIKRISGQSTEAIFKKDEVPKYPIKIDSMTKTDSIQYIYKDDLKVITGQFELAENNDKSFSELLKAKKNIEFVEE